MGGTPADPCDSCTTVLASLALIPWAETAVTAEWPAQPAVDPEPGRFPPEVAWALVGGGWVPMDRRMSEAVTEVMLEEPVAVAGKEHRHEVFPAAYEAFCSLNLLSVGRKGPGVYQRIRLFDINPMANVHTADVLYEFGTLVGARMFPLGAENYGETLLAVDERRRVFALDQGGEWFIADSVDEALISLLTGGFTPRIHDDGTW